MCNALSFESSGVTEMSTDIKLTVIHDAVGYAMRLYIGLRKWNARTPVRVIHR